jgi:peptide deformylase
MRIITDRDRIENECEFVYFKEGLTIARKLLSVCLYGKNKNCVGLAHNQIGGNKKVFVAKIDGKWSVFINAEIKETSTDYTMHEESCMSFPNKFNKVKRYNWITIEHQVQARNNNDGNAFQTAVFDGMNACIVQHEIDHLNGVHIFNKEKEVSK